VPLSGRGRWMSALRRPRRARSAPGALTRRLPDRPPTANANPRFPRAVHATATIQPNTHLRASRRLRSLP
jgi:hypothetical protein